MHKLSIEHLKSGLSISTHIGCYLGCKYCILSSTDNFKAGPMHCATPEDIMEHLMSGTVPYVRNQTPILINNRTDPFLPEVQGSTYEMLELLHRNGVLSPLLLITKMAPDARITSFFTKLNIMVCYTYAGLPEGIDYNSISSINQKNLDTLYAFTPKDSRYLYYRPIIPGLNDNINKFDEVVKSIGRNFNTIIIGGVRILPHNEVQIQTILKDKPNSIEYNHKYFKHSFFCEAVNVARKYDVNLVRHTSCAIAFHMKYKSRLQYFGKNNECNPYCLNYSICVGSCTTSNKKSNLTAFLDAHIQNEYSIHGDSIKIRGRVDQELISCIRNSFGVAITADAIELSPSEKSFLEK